MTPGSFAERVGDTQRRTVVAPFKTAGGMFLNKVYFKIQS